MRVVLRSWREVWEEGATTRRRRVQVPAAVTAAQRTLQMARVRGGDEGGVHTEKIRSGNRRGQTLVTEHELWWRRLRDKVRAIGTWARVVATARPKKLTSR